jgi:hypothetical protein
VQRLTLAICLFATRVLAESSMRQRLVSLSEEERTYHKVETNKQRHAASGVLRWPPDQNDDHVGEGAAAMSDASCIESRR